MKKIVFLCEHHFHYLQGGAEYQVLLLAKNLILQGFEVHHIFIDYGYDNIPTKDESGYLHPLRHWNSNNWYTQYTFSKKLIINIINSIKPDWIYHRNLSYFLNVATEYSLRSQCKTIWHISADKEIRPIKVKFNRKLFRSYFMRKYFIKKGIRNADYIVAQTKFQKKGLQQNFNIDCSLILPNFHPEPKGREKITDKMRIIWVANIKEWKQPEIYIELAKKFYNTENVVFQIAGRLEKNQFGNKINDLLSEAKNIEYLGELSIDEVNQYIDQASIFINTSKPDEGFPNSFIQAWMRNVPVISLNFDPDDVIKTYHLGLHSGSIKQMIQDVKTLINDVKLRNEMGERAKNYAMKYHSESNITDLVSLIH